MIDIILENMVEYDAIPFNTHANYDSQKQLFR